MTSNGSPLPVLGFLKLNACRHAFLHSAINGHFENLFALLVQSLDLLEEIPKKIPMTVTKSDQLIFSVERLQDECNQFVPRTRF